MGLQLTFTITPAYDDRSAERCGTDRSDQHLVLSRSEPSASRTNICTRNLSCRHSLNTLSAYRHNTYFVIYHLKSID